MSAGRYEVRLSDLPFFSAPVANCGIQTIARNGSGHSSGGNTGFGFEAAAFDSSITRFPGEPEPVAPTAVVALQATSDSTPPRLRWQVPTGGTAVSRYEGRCAATMGGVASATVIELHAGIDSPPEVEVTQAGAGFCQVRAVNDAGNGPWSDTVQFTDTGFGARPTRAHLLSRHFVAANPVYRKRLSAALSSTPYFVNEHVVQCAETAAGVPDGKLVYIGSDSGPLGNNPFLDATEPVENVLEFCRMAGVAHNPGGAFNNSRRSINTWSPVVRSTVGLFSGEATTPAPGTVTNLQAARLTDGSFVVRWSAPTSGSTPTAYTMQCGSQRPSVPGSNPTVTVFDHPPPPLVIDGTAELCRVQAHAREAAGAFVDIRGTANGLGAGQTFVVGAPLSPINVGVSNDMRRVRWQAAMSGETPTHYEARCAATESGVTSATAFRVGSHPPPPETSNNALDAFCQLRAVNAAGVGLWGNVVAASNGFTAVADEPFVLRHHPIGGGVGAPNNLYRLWMAMPIYRAPFTTVKYAVQCASSRAAVPTVSPTIFTNRAHFQALDHRNGGLDEYCRVAGVATFNGGDSINEWSDIVKSELGAFDAMTQVVAAERDRNTLTNLPAVQNFEMAVLPSGGFAARWEKPASGTPTAYELVCSSSPSGAGRTPRFVSAIEDSVLLLDAHGEFCNVRAYDHSLASSSWSPGQLIAPLRATTDGFSDPAVLESILEGILGLQVQVSGRAPRFTFTARWLVTGSAPSNIELEAYFDSALSNRAFAVTLAGGARSHTRFVGGRSAPFYYVRVRRITNGMAGSWSSTVRGSAAGFSTIVPPSAPRNFSATTIGSTRNVSLTWLLPANISSSSPEYFFRLVRQDAFFNRVTLATSIDGNTAANSTFAYTDTTVPFADTYTYTLTPYNVVGDGVAVMLAHRIGTAQAEAPTVPRNVTATSAPDELGEVTRTQAGAVRTSSVTLNWQAPATPNGLYVYNVGYTPEGSTEVVTLAENLHHSRTQFVENTVQKLVGTTYTYHVFAENMVGEGDAGTVEYVVPNTLEPIAVNAVSSETIHAGGRLVLQTNSVSPYGEDLLSTWRQVSGPSGAFIVVGGSDTLSGNALEGVDPIHYRVPSTFDRATDTLTLVFEVTTTDQGRNPTGYRFDNRVGMYEFAGGGVTLSDTDTVTVTITAPPVFQQNAGTRFFTSGDEIIVTLPEVLSGYHTPFVYSVNTDDSSAPDGLDELTFDPATRVLSGTVTSTATRQSRTDSSVTTVGDSIAHTFTLTVTDSEGDTDTLPIRIHVFPINPGGAPPLPDDPDEPDDPDAPDNPGSSPNNRRIQNLAIHTNTTEGILASEGVVRNPFRLYASAELMPGVERVNYHWREVVREAGDVTFLPTLGANSYSTAPIAEGGSILTTREEIRAHLNNTSIYSTYNATISRQGPFEITMVLTATATYPGTDSSSKIFVDLSTEVVIPVYERTHAFRPLMPNAGDQQIIRNADRPAFVTLNGHQGFVRPRGFSGGVVRNLGNTPRFSWTQVQSRAPNAPEGGAVSVRLTSANNNRAFFAPPDVTENTDLFFRLDVSLSGLGPQFSGSDTVVVRIQGSEVLISAPPVLMASYEVDGTVTPLSLTMMDTVTDPDTMAMTDVVRDNVPEVVLPPGTRVTLHLGSSSDPTGESLQYMWREEVAPAHRFVTNVAFDDPQADLTMASQVIDSFDITSRTSRTHLILVGVTDGGILAVNRPTAAIVFKHPDRMISVDSSITAPSGPVMAGAEVMPTATATVTVTPTGRSAPLTYRWSYSGATPSFGTPPPVIRDAESLTPTFVFPEAAEANVYLRADDPAPTVYRIYRKAVADLGRVPSEFSVVPSNDIPASYQNLPAEQVLYRRVYADNELPAGYVRLRAGEEPPSNRLLQTTQYTFGLQATSVSEGQGFHSRSSVTYTVTVPDLTATPYFGDDSGDELVPGILAVTTGQHSADGQVVMVRRESGSTYNPTGTYTLIGGARVGLAYQWNLESANPTTTVPIPNPTSAMPNIVLPTLASSDSPVTLVFTLTVRPATGANPALPVTNRMTVVVLPPASQTVLTAEAGANFEATQSEIITLNGGGSQSNTAIPLSYSWRYIGRTPSGGSFTPAAGITEGTSSCNRDTCTITPTDIPSTHPTYILRFSAAGVVELDVEKFNAGDVLRFELRVSASRDPSVTAVTDTVEVTVIALNRPPVMAFAVDTPSVVNIPVDQQLFPVRFDGRGSMDTEGDAFTYEWSTCGFVRGVGALAQDGAPGTRRFQINQGLISSGVTVADICLRGRNTFPFTDGQLVTLSETVSHTVTLNYIPTAVIGFLPDEDGTVDDVEPGERINILNAVDNEPPASGQPATRSTDRDTGTTGMTFNWELLEPTSGDLTNISLAATRAQPAFTAPVAPSGSSQEFVFGLTVNDGIVDSGQVTVTVTLNYEVEENVAPMPVLSVVNVATPSTVLYAGPPSTGAAITYTVNEGATIRLSAAASTDANRDDDLTYTWSVQPEGLRARTNFYDGATTSTPLGVGAATTVATPLVVVPQVSHVSGGSQIVRFSVTVSDGTIERMLAIPVAVISTTSNPPVAVARFAQSFYDAGDVTLVNQDSGGTRQVPELQFTINGGMVNGGTALVTVSLDGTMSSDPDTVSLQYNWRQTVPREGPGSRIALVNANTATPHFVIDPSNAELNRDIALGFVLRVLDVDVQSPANDAPESVDTVRVVITHVNTPPVAVGTANSTRRSATPPDGLGLSAADNITVREGERVTLFGSGTDADNQPLSYSWEQVPLAGSARTQPIIPVTLECNPSEPDCAAVRSPTFVTPTGLGANATLRFALFVDDGQALRPNEVGVPDQTTDPEGFARVMAERSSRSRPGYVTITVMDVNTRPVAVLSYDGERSGSPSSPMESVAQVTLSAQDSTDDGGYENLTFVWAQVGDLQGTVGATITHPVTLTYPHAPDNSIAVFTAPRTTTEVTLYFSAVATDRQGATSSVPSAVEGEPASPATLLVPVAANVRPDRPTGTVTPEKQAVNQLVTMSVSATDPDFPPNIRDDALRPASTQATFTWAQTFPLAGAPGGDITLCYVECFADGNGVMQPAAGSNDRRTHAYFTVPNDLLSDTRYTFSVIANDGMLDSNPGFVNVITDGNLPPVIAAWQPSQHTAMEGQTITLTASGYDPDGADDELVFTWEQADNKGLFNRQYNVAERKISACRGSDPTPCADETVDTMPTEQYLTPGNSVRNPVQRAGVSLTYLDERRSRATYVADPFAKDGAMFVSFRVSGTDGVHESATVVFTTAYIAANSAPTFGEAFVYSPNTAQVQDGSNTPIDPETGIQEGRLPQLSDGRTLNLIVRSAADLDAVDTNLTYIWTVLGDDRRLSRFSFDDGVVTAEDPPLLAGVNPLNTRVSPIRRGDVVFSTVMPSNLWSMPTTLSFQLVVSDGELSSPPQVFEVELRPDNDAPLARLDEPYNTEGPTVSAGDVITLGASAFDIEQDPLTYLWSQDFDRNPNAPDLFARVDATSPTLELTIPHVRFPSTVQVTFSATDSSGLVGTDIMQITLLSNTPTAGAGDDQTVEERQIVTLDARGSIDSQQQALTYSWRQTSTGPTTGQDVGKGQVQLNDATSARPTFTAPQQLFEDITITFAVAVTDTDGNRSLESTVDVVVEAGPNDPPVAADTPAVATVDAGSTVTLNIPNIAVDPEGDALMDYVWEQVAPVMDTTQGARNVGVSLSLSNTDTPNVSFDTPLLATATLELTFHVRVTDVRGAMSEPIPVVVTVLQTSNMPPTDAAIVTNALDNVAVSETIVMLTGSGSDPEGGDILYKWTTDGRDSRVTLLDSSGAAIAADADASRSSIATFFAPDYLVATPVQVTLTIFDGGGATDRAVLTVTVAAGAVNNLPSAVASLIGDSTVNENGTITLSGTGADPEIQPLRYTWSFTHDTEFLADSSNFASVLTSANTNNAVESEFVMPELVGNATLVFTLTTNDGVMNSNPGDPADNPDNSPNSRVTIVVTGINDPAVVSAGSDRRYADGAAARLVGTAFDPEGLAITYLWTLENAHRNGQTLLGPDGAPLLATDSRYSTDIELINPTELVVSFLVPELDDDAPPVTLNFVLTATVADTTTVGVASPTVLRDPVNVIIVHAVPVNKMFVAEATRTIAAGAVGAITQRINTISTATSPIGSIKIGGQETLAGALQMHGDGMANGTNDWRTVLRDTEFALPLSSGLDSRGRSSVALWGSGDYRNLSGEDESQKWEGTMTGMHVGVDARLTSGNVFGLALSRVSGDFDYDPFDGNENGTYELTMTSAHPYLDWTWGDVDMWGLLGYGTGELNVDGGGGDVTGANTVEMSTYGFGGAGDVWRKPNGNAMRFKGEFTGSSVNVTHPVDPEANVSAGSFVLRAALEASRSGESSSGRPYSQSAEVGLRNDGGDGNVGRGAEIAASTRSGDPSRGISSELRLHALLGHSGDYSEWGIRGSIRSAPGADGQGLSFNLSPGYGTTGISGEKVWGELPDEFKYSDDETTDATDDYHMRLDARIGYGLPLAIYGNYGLLTPFTEATLGQTNTYRLGLNWKGANRLEMTLLGKQTESGVEVDNSVLLKGEVGF